MSRRPNNYSLARVDVDEAQRMLDAGVRKTAIARHFDVEAYVIHRLFPTTQAYLELHRQRALSKQIAKMQEEAALRLHSRQAREERRREPVQYWNPEIGAYQTSAEMKEWKKGHDDHWAIKNMNRVLRQIGDR